MAVHNFSTTRAPKRTAAEIDAEVGIRPRMEVFAETVAGIVTSVGGWLSDRALAGWDIHVYLPGGQDFRPLDILGIASVREELNAWSPHRTVRSASIAISDEVLRHRPGFAAAVDRLIARRSADVTVWGDDGRPPELERSAWRLRPLEYHPSGAAALFKKCAQHAAGQTAITGCAERLSTNACGDTKVIATANGPARQDKGSTA